MKTGVLLWGTLEGENKSEVVTFGPLLMAAPRYTTPECAHAIVSARVYLKEPWKC